ncbi:hypothetical protein ACIBFB_01930 [Nocardiopsis sp. NPDC050513]|uniref:hypothetical protein n=1 Tax=Nocardiopsis sp. NPDC050513 TaxID=3364338 RepID=UPI0037B915AD
MVLIAAIRFVTLVVTAFVALVSFFVLLGLRFTLPRDQVEPRRPDGFRYGPPPEEETDRDHGPDARRVVGACHHGRSAPRSAARDLGGDAWRQRA